MYKRILAAILVVAASLALFGSAEQFKPTVAVEKVRLTPDNSMVLRGEINDGSVLAAQLELAALDAKKK